VAGYVHNLGLKFGLYVTPGISKQAATQAIPIAGTDETTSQIANTSVSEHNYNCGGMVDFQTQADPSVPGGQVLVPAAQQFLDNWADEFASWGVDSCS
jgi:alpha-galactosidase